MLITPSLNRRLHQLLTKLHIMDMKQELVENYTEHRTTHSSDMTYNEALQLIKSLELNDKGYDELDKLRKKVISLMTEMWGIDEHGKADMHFIYWFSLNYIWKKQFNSLKKEELQGMISILKKQFMPWFYKNKALKADFSIKTLRESKLEFNNN